MNNVMNRPRACLIATLLTLCAFAVGFRKDRMRIHPVEGKLLVAGKPAGSANIYFYPRDPNQQRIPVAVTAADGTFRLTTIDSGDGAPEGLYDVTVVWPDYSIPRDECADPIHDRLKLRYADRSDTELHAVVRPGKNEFILRAEMMSGGSAPQQHNVQR